MYCSHSSPVRKCTFSDSRNLPDWTSHKHKHMPTPKRTSIQRDHSTQRSHPRPRTHPRQLPHAHKHQHMSTLVAFTCTLLLIHHLHPRHLSHHLRLARPYLPLEAVATRRNICLAAKAALNGPRRTTATNRGSSWMYAFAFISYTIVKNTPFIIAVVSLLSSNNCVFVKNSVFLPTHRQRRATISSTFALAYFK